MDYTVPTFICQNPECAFHPKPESAYYRDPYDGGLYCGDCGSEVKYAEEALAQFVSVAAYSTDRAYGGPEEGGWYYTEGDRIDATLRCFEPGDYPQVQEYVELLHRRYEGHKNVCVETYCDRIAPKSFPDSKPVYS